MFLLIFVIATVSPPLSTTPSPLLPLRPDPGNPPDDSIYPPPGEPSVPEPPGAILQPAEEGLGSGLLPTVPPRPPYDGPFRNLSSGDISYYRYGDSGFTGGCFAIRRGTDWEAFWAVHASGGLGRTPPVVDFEREIVLGCILGFVSTCCSAYVQIFDIVRNGSAYRAVVKQSASRGMMMAVTNPYNFVAAPRTEGQVTFHHRVWWGPEIPQIPPVP